MLESAGLTVKSLEMIYYRGHPSSMPALFRCEGSKIEKKKVMMGRYTVYWCVNGLAMYCHQLFLVVRMIWFSYRDKNDMAAHALWAVFCSSWRPCEIGQAAENNGAAIPPPISFLGRYKKVLTLGRGLSKIAKKVLTYVIIWMTP